MKTKNNQTLIQSVLLEKLQAFGLTKQESKIYVYLTKNGPKKVADIAKDERILRTRVYQILETLGAKGAVGFQNDMPKKFHALPIENTIDSIINFESKKIDEINQIKGDLAYLWHIANNLDIIENQNFLKIDNAVKKYASSNEFRKDFKSSLKKFQHHQRLGSKDTM